jgi:hypothetical protein
MDGTVLLLLWCGLLKHAQFLDAKSGSTTLSEGVNFFFSGIDFLNPEEAEMDTSI